jgi:hypothetical protein
VPPPVADRALQQVESLQICDARGALQPAMALLDTGNEHLTCIDQEFAVAIGIYSRSAGGHDAASTTTLRGIVPDAEVEAPVVHVRLQIRGVDFGPMPVALTKLERARPVLLGMDVLAELFRQGFHISR